jgi:hypothetical protein
VSSGTVSRLNRKIYRHIEAWRNREIVGDFPASAKSLGLPKGKKRIWRVGLIREVTRQLGHEPEP